MARAKIFMVNIPNQGKNVFPKIFWVTAHVIQQLKSPHTLAYAIVKQHNSSFPLSGVLSFFTLGNG